MLYSNVRSISGKINELKAVAVDIDSDVIVLCETWTNDTIDNSFLEIPGFKLMIRKDRSDTDKGRGGGLLVYVKKGITCYEKNISEEIIQAASLTFPMVDHDLHLHVIYRSPNSSPDNNESINTFVQNIGRNSIIIGDFNYPNICWETLTSNNVAEGFVNTVNEKFLTQHVDFPTHEAGNLLDLVLSNIPNRMVRVEERGKLGNSDHFMIFAEIEACYSARTQKHIVWNFAKAEFQEMGNKLRSIDWRNVLCNDIETDWGNFKKIFHELCVKHVPKKTVSEKNRPPWLHRELIQMIRRKKLAWKQYRLSNSAADFNTFKTLEKKVKKAVKNAKHNYEKQLSKNAKSNPKLFLCLFE